MSKAYTVSLSGTRWLVRREGDLRSTDTYISKADAWSTARRKARSVQGEALLHERDGSVAIRSRYDLPVKRK